VLTDLRRWRANNAAGLSAAVSHYWFVAWMGRRIGRQIMTNMDD